MRKPAHPRAIRARRVEVLAAGAILIAALGGACRERSPSVSERKPGPPPASPVGPPPEQTPEAQLAALVRDDLDAELALHPTLASWLGDHGWDDKLDDVRTDAQVREANRLRQLTEQLRGLRDTELSPNARLDRRLLLRRSEAALHELSELRPLERNPLVYLDIAQAGVESLVAGGRFLDPDGLRSLNGRLWRMRALFDEARRNLRGSSPDLAVRRAIDVAQGLRAFLGDALPRLVQSVPDARAVDDARAAIGDASRALDELIGWLQRDFQPRAHGDLALGAQRWWDRLRIAEAMPGTLEQLVPRVEAAVKESARRVDEAGRAALAGPPGAAARPASDLQRLIEDDHPRADELLPRMQSLCEQLFAVARERSLARVPTAGLPRVVEMPPQITGLIRVVAPAPLEKQPRDAVVWVDPAPRSASERMRLEHLRLLNRPSAAVALAHELLGHYLVALARRQAPTLMQRFTSSVVLEEGFAHRMEQLALLEPPFGSDARVRLVAERAAQLRLLRLLGTIRFHAQGLRFEELVRLFGDEADLDEYTARKEAERVALDPMAGAEALGRLELDRLQRDWQGVHPEGTTAAFHEALLAHGAAPIDVLRDLLLPAP